ncbi:MAG: UPF0182 family protein, partial [Microbacteriaceae bacterium]|nr:UPF0182 family protein [Microbacteriaceae bacterium]
DGARNILTGYLAANANAGTGKAGVVNENYGKLRLLELPKGSAISGPGQVQNNFNANPNVSQVLNILRQGETKVVNGNLLTLPVGGGLLYVQPVYVQSKNGGGYPLLQRVLVSFGDNIAFEKTLDEALDVLFGGNSGAHAGDKKVQDAAKPDAAKPDGEKPGDKPGEVKPGDTKPGETKPAETKPGEQKPGTKPGDGKPAAKPELKAALQEMQTALAARDKAMREGDWAAYGRADAQLKAAIEKALQASN